MAGAIAGLTLASVLGTSLVAYADNIQDDIVDNVASALQLVAGSTTGATAQIRVIGNMSGSDTDPGCNIDAGEPPLVLDLITPTGITANPDPLSITACGTDFPVTFTAAADAVSGNVTVAFLSYPDSGRGYFNQVSIPIVVTQPQPTNTAPSVSVIGVSSDTYEIGSEPTPMCSVTDAEDGPSEFPAAITGTLAHGLGTLTATCDYTDQGGLTAPTATATYTIVDTGDPTITHTLTPAAPNAAGWFNTPVLVAFTCADSGSGVQSCGPDTTVHDGADQSVTGTAVDWAGNTATDVVSGLNVDTVAPTVGFEDGFGSTHYYGSVPTYPACVASDALSGVASCVVTGGGTNVGTHTLTATATDVAGNTAEATLTYEVLAWTLKGFTNPVDMGSVLNTVKGGSTVPLKFEIFAGSTELTSVTAIQSFTTAEVACGTANFVADEIEVTSTGGTVLRYDTTGGQFIQNWATPKKPGTCHTVTMTAQDGSSITAFFKLK